MKKLTLEQEGTHTTANEQTNSKSLINKEPIEGTPFTLVETENGCFIALANYRLTELITREKCNEIIHGNKTDWNFLAAVIDTIQKITIQNN